MLEDYFAQEKERLEEDLRPELGYQVVSPPRAKIGVDRSSALSVGPLIVFIITFRMHHEQPLTHYPVLPLTYRAQPWKTPKNPLANP
jgi:hypothetical protein